MIEDSFLVKMKKHPYLLTINNRKCYIRNDDLSRGQHRSTKSNKQMENRKEADPIELSRTAMGILQQNIVFIFRSEKEDLHFDGENR